jgi:hypothetical protein
MKQKLKAIREERQSKKSLKEIKELSDTMKKSAVDLN